ncbi:hypothetical protein ACRTDU_07470 [Sunxiuqinia elliptica]
MTEQDHDLINEFKKRIKLLIAKQDGLKEENQRLVQQISELQGELNTVRDENEELVKKYSDLKMAKVFSASDDEKQEAKQTINKIVREIDKCIAQLNV